VCRHTIQAARTRVSFSGKANRDLYISEVGRVLCHVISLKSDDDSIIRIEIGMDPQCTKIPQQ